MRNQIFFFFLGLSFLVTSQAQVPDSTGRIKQLTPGGFFDKVHDRWGNAYAINTLAVNDTLRADAIAAETRTTRHIIPTSKGSTTCSSTGYFNIYYDNDFCGSCDSTTKSNI